MQNHSVTLGYISLTEHEKQLIQLLGRLAFAGMGPLRDNEVTWRSGCPSCYNKTLKIGEERAWFEDHYRLTIILAEGNGIGIGCKAGCTELEIAKTVGAQSK